MDRIRNADERLLAWILLGVAMCISATWLMIAGKDLTFSGDDIFYYARLIVDNGAVHQAGGIEYFFIPHNGHLQLLGKLLYRGLFVTVGADYTVFRAIEVFAAFVCVLLTFILLRRRVRPYAALIPCILLLFFGYGEGSFLWPFNIHTIGALAFGLGALLTLERDDRRGDIATCALLVLAVATVEVGLAFTVAVAVAVLRRDDRWRRAWIFLTPLVLFAIWYVWARKFGQSEVELVNVKLIPMDLTNALAAVMGSIFGVNPTGPEISPNVTTITPWASVLAGFAVVGLIYRIRQGKVPMGLWIALAAVLTYWLMITMADRPPDSTRYLFVGVVAVFLIAGSALRGRRIATAGLIVAAGVVAFAIPPNIAKFYDERASSVTDADNTRTEYAMLELARPHVHSDYFPATDPSVSDAGGAVFVPLSAYTYYQAADEFGPIGFSLEQIRHASVNLRHLADATLIGALELKLKPTEAPADPSSCPSSLDGKPGHPVFFFLEPGGVLLGSRSGSPVHVGLGRFGTGGASVSIGKLQPGEWGNLRIPTDSAPDRWWVTVDGPVRVCPPGG
ncbi:MAG TPA: hypothetical protein VFN89_12630 [Solirubrobacterales bacterium]|nr:hypothetical protein [Solirubrobacterales bacterium]